MESTTLAISIEGAGLIAASIVGSGLLIYFASARAHAKIIGRLCDLEGDMKVVKNDLDWLKHFARTGQPPPDQSQS